MMAFPGMLVGAAEQAGMSVPADPTSFDAEQFPHFHVFCTVQLGRAMRPGEHWGNADVVQGVPLDKIKEVTLAELIDRGLQITLN